MLSIWCEWDVGQEHYVFKTKEAAMKWLENNNYIKEILEEESTLDELFDDGLIGYTELKVVE